MRLEVGRRAKGERPLRLLWILLLAVVLTGCSRETPPPADYREAGELRVATRLDAISFMQQADGRASGFEHDLVEELGRYLGVPVRFVVYPDLTRALDAVLKGHAHMAIGSLGRNPRLPFRWSAPLREVDYVLVGRDDQPEIDSEADLTGRTVSVRRGSLPVDTLERMIKRRPGLKLRFSPLPQDLALLQEVADGKADLAATDREHFALAAQTRPGLAIAYDLPVKSAIAWALSPDRGQALAEQVDAFIAEAGASGLLARIADRYFGHIHRLTDADVTAFVSRIRERLPRYRRDFEEAQARTGIDWRLLAALAYQESQWDPLATSPTGVRGMMMLTADTADRLGVDDRLDPRASILGGARYFAMLREELAGQVEEPDRSWLATAAYNLGMGHLNGARAIARRLGKDDTAWWTLKSVLPLLSRPEYAARLKAGAARGGEAVIMTENVRSFHDILVRLEPPYSPPLQPAGLKLDAHGDRSGGRLPPLTELTVGGP